VAADFKLNMGGLIAISNAANDGVCREVAEAAMANMVASAPKDSGAYAGSFDIESESRTGVADFAHTRIRNSSPYALKVEAKHGTMARGLGGV